MKAVDVVMRWPWVYRLWMSGQVDKKFAPIVAHNDLRAVRRVLDVGCGPGTNAPQFAHTEYLGIDWNERYIRAAEARYRRRFEVGDATKLVVPDRGRFDFILVNSLLHHIDIEATRRLLAHLPSVMAPGGHIHIIELVLPARLSLPYLLARADRGEYPRPVDEWRRIFTETYEEIVFEPFDVSFGGVAFWNMVYFKGRARS